MRIHFSLSRNVRNSERGQSLVELAIGAVVLFTLMAGVIDFGLAFINFVAMRDAAQEGAIYGSIHPKNCTEIRNHALESAKTLLTGVTVGDIEVLIDGTTSCEGATTSQACAGKQIQVTVSQPHYPISMPFIGGILPLPNEINLKATIKDTILTPKCTGP